MRPLVCSSSPTRLPLRGPSPPFPVPCAPLTPRISSFSGNPRISSVPSTPRFPPPASSHMTGRAPPRDVTVVCTLAPVLPPHSTQGADGGGGRTWSARSALPNQKSPELCSGRSRGGARVPGCAPFAEAPPSPPAPRAPPPSAPLRPAFPSLSCPPPFSCLEVAGQREPPQ